MYSNLRKEMIQANISKMELAKAIGISYNTFRDKIRGRRDWKLPEMLKVQSILNNKNQTNKTIDDLFQK